MTAQKVPDDLLFFVADTLGIPVHLMGEHFRGADTRRLRLGHWTTDAEISACSDVLSTSVASFLVKVKGSVWLYVVSEKDSIKIYVFDGSVIGLRVKDMSTFGGASVPDTLSKLAHAVRGAFKYANEGWEKIDAGVMDEAPVS